MSRHRVTRAQPHQSQPTATAALSSPVASGNALTLRHRDEDENGTSTAVTANAAVLQPFFAPCTEPLSAPSREGPPQVQQSIAPLNSAPAEDGAVLPSSENHSSGPASSLAPLTTVPQALPSLLRYVDHDLMQNAAAHNHPQQPNATCAICLLPWDSPVPLSARINEVPQVTSHPTPAVRSTFLPLTPCGHWVHYRCFIYSTTQTNSDGKNRCFVCRTPLFRWEGITALTLAIRTGFQLEERIRNDADRLVNTFTGPSFADFEAECEIIDAVVPQYFYAQLTQASPFSDGSLDLVTVYYGVINGLATMRRPASRWLSYHTDLGYLLFCMLVCIKMRRWLLEVPGHQGIERTEGWRTFEEGRMAIQRFFLAEVHK